MTSTTFIALTGTFAFAVSGTLAGAKRNLDLIGVCFIAFISALGGSTIRDMLIGNYPLSWVANRNYIILVIAGVLFALLFKKRLIKIPKMIFIIDSIGIGTFTIYGVEHCLVLHLNTLVSIFFGVLSVTAGSVIRDVLCNEIPVILKKDLNASAAIIGSSVYVLFLRTGCNSLFFLLFSISLIASLRLLFYKFKWSLPVISL
ncbi:MAG: trimeric intracellular cation channel family protein [Bacteroidota bacterium]